MRSAEGERQLVFRKAVDFLRSGWCKGSPAVDKHGRATMFDDPDAVSFCATGALDKAAKELMEQHVIVKTPWHRIDGQDYLVVSDECRRIAESKLGPYVALTDFNDQGAESVEDVVDLLELCAR